jgi:beta-glucanase (GH16 family)
MIQQYSNRTTLCVVLLTLLVAAVLPLNAQSLVWEENFTATTINSSIWTYDFGTGCERGNCGWGNGELEYYTSRTDNARIESGSLIIEAKREAFQGSAFTSARLKTEGRMHFKYGTIEARIKLPNMTKGLWPAFWTLGTIGNAWPGIGEIDMMEAGNGSAMAAGIGNKQVTAAAHWSNAGGGHEYTANPITAAVDLSADYHLYKMVWTANALTMYLDNVAFYTLDISNPADPKYSEFHTPHFLLLNVAIGGAYTGVGDAAGVTAPLPGQMSVDYVKLYQNPGDYLFIADNAPAVTGSYGILTDNTPTLAGALTYGTDADLYYWNNLTAITNPVAYEGTNVWAVHANANNWFGMGVENQYKNLSAFGNGSLHFRYKSSYTGQFKIGVKTGHGESWINFATNTTAYGLTRNGQWSEVSIPLSAFQNPSIGNNIDLYSVKNAFMFAGDPSVSATDFYFDDVYYSLTTPVINAPPTVSITSPTNNATFTPASTIIINATAADADGTVSQVDFYNGATLLGTDNTAPYSYTWTNVAAGNYIITAKATDNSTAVTTSSAVNVNVVSTSLDGYCGTVASGDYQYKVATVGTTVTFTFHPLTPIVGCNLALIYIREGAGGYAGTAMTAVGPDFVYTKTIADGTPLSIYFTYNTPPVGERNSAATPHSYIVGANCTGGTPPTVSITSPTNNATYTEPVALINIAAIAADADGTIAKVEFFNGSTLMQTKTNAPYTFDLTNVAAGNYNIVAKATDNDGLFTWSNTVKVIVNPDNSGGFCGTLANGDYSYKAVTSGGNVTFSFHPLSPIAGCALSIIYIRQNGVGGYAGNGMTAVGNDFKYTQAIASGTVLSFYFTYSTPPTGERNSAATPHSYTVGTNCVVVPVGNVSITAAPVPTRLAANVISLFSNTYTDIAGADWFPNWGQTTVVTDTLITGNTTKKFFNLNYQGTQFASAINLTAAGMTNLHIDYWSPNVTSFDVFLVTTPPLFTQAEQKFTFTPTLSGWNSIDIPLTAYNTLNLAGISQIKWEGRPSGGVVYLDNIYFWKPTVAVPTVPLVAAPDPTRLQPNVISLFSGVYTNVASTDWFPNWGQSTVVTEEMIAGNPTKKFTNLNYEGTQFANPINLTTAGMTGLHIDYWSPTVNSFDVFLVTTPPLFTQAEQKFTFTPTLSGWNSIDIPLTAYNTLNLAGISQIKWEGRPSGGVVYLDNIYFWKPPVIPVEMVFFKAKAVNNTTVLDWQTASERNNRAFDIERSNNGTAFTFIGTIKGNGTTSSINNYTFTDETPVNGVNYYRLKQVDNDGKATQSKVVSVVIGKNGFVLHNTLVHDVLNMTVSDNAEGPLPKESGCAIRIFNVSGQLMITTTVKGNQQLNLNGLASGMYIVRTATGAALRFVKD